MITFDLIKFLFILKNFLENEVLVRLSIGNLIGRKHIVRNVPWTAEKDPLEMERPTSTHFDPDPVPLSNNVSVYAFLGVPYAEPPVSQRRFKVCFEITLL